MGDGVSRADISAPTLRPNQCRSIGGGARGYTLDVGKGGQAQGPPPLLNMPVGQPITPGLSLGHR